MEDNHFQSPYRQKLREQIVAAAMTAFAQKGVKAVKMDDIAQSLGISKRTLYEIYANKELLLYEGIVRAIKEKEAYLLKVQEECETVMDVVLRLYKRNMENRNRTNPQFFEDIKKYPRLADVLENDKRASQQRFVAFLQRGMAEGFFRSDLDYELVTRLISMMSEYVMSAKLYSKYSLHHIFHNMLFVIMRGICTRKGIEILDQIVTTEGK